MTVRIFKGVWLASLLGTLTVFMYVYASLPETIQVSEGLDPAYISRGVLFYSTLTVLALVNAMVFLVSRSFIERSEFFVTWFYGLVVFLNIFFSVSLQFLNVYNSQEKFNYESIGYIIYGSLVMIVLWAFVWPVYFITQRFFNKPSV